jgi:hypothetical protein
MKLLKVIFVVFIASLFFYACKKEFSIEAGNISDAVGTWEFSDSSILYSGNMDSVSIVTTGVTKELHLDGKSLDETQNFHMVLYADSFQTGAYKASVFQSTFDYSEASKAIYKATQLNGEFTVNVTTINNSEIEGTFSGTAKDSSGKATNINNGKFKASFSAVVTAPTSKGVLGDSLGNCMPVDTNGVYKEGVAMTAENTVQVQVTVTEPGTYSISTPSVNGIMFSASGTFTQVGVQNVILQASGTPAVAGEQTFALRYGNSQCAFKVNCIPAASASGDYLPLTLNSNWKYSLQGGTAADSTFSKVIDYSLSTGTNTYQTIARFSVLSPGTAIDSFYYRKPGGDYYEFMNYTRLLGLDNDVSGEFIFLKDNVEAGTTWNSPTISGTISGTPISGYAKMTLLEKAVPITVGPYNFPDVIKVKYEYFFDGASNATITIERWFAKNIGEIYDRYSKGVLVNVNQIEEYQVF